MRIVENLLAYDGALRPLRPSLAHDWVEEEWVLNPQKHTALLQQAQERALAVIEQSYNQLVHNALGQPSSAEKETWNFKREVAQAVLNQQELSPAAQNFLENAGLHETRAQHRWSQAVLRRCADYGQIVGTAEKLRRQAQTAFKETQDLDTLEQEVRRQREQFSAAQKSLSLARALAEPIADTATDKVNPITIDLQNRLSGDFRLMTTGDFQQNPLFKIASTPIQITNVKWSSVSGKT